MPVLRVRRHRFTTTLAAVLLALEGATGAAVGLVHAAERVSAPAAVESGHDARCPVLHDAARCPQCQLAGLLAGDLSRTTLLARGAERPGLAPTSWVLPAAVPDRAVPPPRAPPRTHS